jgi:hypothetical protein
MPFGRDLVSNVFPKYSKSPLLAEKRYRALMANRDRRSNPPIATTITIFAGAKFGPIKSRSHDIMLYIE